MSTVALGRDELQPIGLNVITFPPKPRNSAKKRSRLQIILTVLSFGVGKIRIRYFFLPKRHTEEYCLANYTHTIITSIQQLAFIILSQGGLIEELSVFGDSVWAIFYRHRFIQDGYYRTDRLFLNFADNKMTNGTR